MHDLRGKVAVVTGGASGIGLALAEALVAEGMKVALADIDADRLAAEAQRLTESGAEVVPAVVDVADPAAVDGLRDAVLARFGAVHLVANNAGVGGLPGPVWEMGPEVWDWTLSINLLGVANGIRSFVPVLLEQGEGHVLNTASAAGLVAIPTMSAYSASKHAVVALSEILWHDLQTAGATGVGVTVLCPEFVRTRIADPDAAAPPVIHDYVEAHPELAPAREFIAAMVDSGTEPHQTAALAIDAIRSDRFLAVDPALVNAAAEALNTMADGQPPPNPFG